MFLQLNAKMRRLWEGVFSSSDKVLDIGCGEHPKYHRYIPSSIVCADKMPGKKVHLLSDAQILPFKPSSFDGVVSVNALYYCENPHQAIREFSRVLKKGGKMVMVTPFIYPIHDAPHDRYRFTEYGLREILKEDFSIDKIVPIGGLFSFFLLCVHSAHKGLLLVFPTSSRRIINVVLSIILLPFYLLAELIGLLDVFDRSRRWPIYYFTIAIKK